MPLFVPLAGSVESAVRVATQGFRATRVMSDRKDRRVKGVSVVKQENMANKANGESRAIRVSADRKASVANLVHKVIVVSRASAVCKVNGENRANGDSAANKASVVKQGLSVHKDRKVNAVLRVLTVVMVLLVRVANGAKKVNAVLKARWVSLVQTVQKARKATREMLASLEL